jgi:hypothetical protein
MMRLSWVERIRAGQRSGREAEDILQEVLRYGEAEERRIQGEFDEQSAHHVAYPKCERYPVCKSDGLHEAVEEPLKVEDIDVEFVPLDTAKDGDEGFDDDAVGEARYFEGKDED